MKNRFYPTPTKKVSILTQDTYVKSPLGTILRGISKILSILPLLQCHYIIPFFFQVVTEIH